MLLRKSQCAYRFRVVVCPRAIVLRRHPIAELSLHDQARHCIRQVEVPLPTRSRENQLVSDLPLHPALMRQKAVAEQSGDESHKAGDSYALAIEPDASQAAILERTIGARIGGTLKVVASTEEAFAALERRLPDLILVSPLLPPQDEEQIVARLAARGGDASHVQLLSIPRIRDGEQPSEKKRRFGWQSQKDASSVSEGCDPVAFANEVAEYLAQAATLRQASEPVEVHDPAVRPAGDTTADLHIEHIEQLLQRFDAEPLPPVESDASSVSEREPMPTSTTHEPAVGTVRNTGDTRLPRFLTLDDQVPLPLRALLDEADGCLKMSFLTGAGACAERTLDLLLSEQGLGGADRAEQILQLGKKHPAVAESFMRGLSLVTNHPSGAWDEARATLAVTILKAIAYEIYVLGPERKERAAYVIELLGRYKSAGKN